MSKPIFVAFKGYSDSEKPDLWVNLSQIKTLSDANNKKHCFIDVGGKYLITVFHPVEEVIQMIKDAI